MSMAIGCGRPVSWTCSRTPLTSRASPCSSVKGMSQLKVEILDKSIEYQGFFKLLSYRLRHALFGGGMSRELRREAFERGHAVGVLPYDPARGVVALVSSGERRVGEGRTWE